MEVKLIVREGKNQGREIPVAAPEFLIGRAEGCHLQPSSERVSRKHCVIRQREGCVFVTDLNSTNHTFVNGAQITGECELKNGDQLRVGVLEFDVQLSVSVGGKKKPKVNSIQEAAARTVETTAPQDDDIDISDWLDEDEMQPPQTAPSSDHLSISDTRAVADKMTETTMVPTPHIAGEKKKEEEKKAPPAKTTAPHHYDFKKKPVAGADTHSVASDTLRHFLTRKK